MASDARGLFTTNVSPTAEAAGGSSCQALCLGASAMAKVFFTCSASSDYVRNRIVVRALERKHKVGAAASAAPSYPCRLAAVVPRIPTASRTSLPVAPRRLPGLPDGLRAINHAGA